MSDKAKPRGRPFVTGYDPRRRVLTRDDCKKGYANAPSRIKCRIRGMYRGKKIKRKGPGAYLPPVGEER